MRGNGAPYPLYDEKSTSVYSPAFAVSPGRTVIFQAFGFGSSPRQVTPGESWLTPQATLQQILYMDPLAGLLPDDVLGDGVHLVDILKIQGQVLAEGPVVTDGCCWELSACRTMALLDVPGSYRFLLNDPAELGLARIYMRAINTPQDFYRASALYFGED